MVQRAQSLFLPCRWWMSSGWLCCASGSLSDGEGGTVSFMIFLVSNSLRKRGEASAFRSIDPAHHGDSHTSYMRCLFLQPFKHQILWPCRCAVNLGPHPVNLAFQCIILWRRKRFIGMRCIGQFAQQGFQLGKKINHRLPRSSVHQTVGFPLRVCLPSLIYQVLARVHIDMGWAALRSTDGML